MKELDNVNRLNQDIQTLTQLGLSHRQARVYLALLISGTSTAKTISIVSKVPRQDVYTVIPILEKMGLSQKTITKPFRFRATPIEKGIQLLMNRKSEEYNQMQVNTKNLLDSLKNYHEESADQEDKVQFFLLPETQARIQRIEEAVTNAENIVDSFTTPEILRQVAVLSVGVLKKSLKRGVTFRFLTEEPKDKDFKLGIPRAILKNPRLEIRYVASSIPAAAVLIDKKEMFFGTTIDFQKATYLWSNNPYLVGLIQNHFEQIWNSILKTKSTQ